MKLIVGLGNPGKQYERTRHNAGFLAIDALLNKINASLDQEGFKAHYTTYRKNGEKVLIVKPQTYMNLSGESVRAIMDYFKVDVEDILIIHDDLDLPLGKLRLRTSGSSGGQNGMKNIIEHLSTKDIKRIRIGIAHDKTIDTKDYVLSKITGDDWTIMFDAVNKAAEAVLYWLDEPDFSKVMSKFN